MVLDEEVEVPGWLVVVAGRVVVTGVPSVDNVAVIIDPEPLISVMLTLLAPSFHKLLLGEELLVKEVLLVLPGYGSPWLPLFFFFSKSQRLSACIRDRW